MGPRADDGTAAEGRLQTCLTYGIAFRDVWDALLQTLASFRHWQLHEANPRAGTVHATTTSALGYLPLEGTFTLSLDELGQTRLEIRFETPKHALLDLIPVARSRRVVRRLERFLGAFGRG